jgi:glutamyl-Q tRNA(Asp) synthetase
VTPKLAPLPGGERKSRARSPGNYVGRFAPSPTGDLHIGSLVAAVGSFLDARHRGGRWLLRIEDLDTPRVLPGCADRMLRTLEQLGLEWDGEVVYQSRRIERYHGALEELKSQGLTFACSCSRRDLTGGEETGYPGTCRSGPTRRGAAATRFRVDDAAVVLFEDGAQGSCRFELRALGDFVIQRKDGTVSYQLAVVVDDAEQRVTDVVRGADLLSSTPWQIALQRALRLPALHYAHLPLVVEATREKLAKSRHSVPIDAASAGRQLAAALTLLNHPAPAELVHAGPKCLLDWAIRNWSLEAFQGLLAVALPTQVMESASPAPN